MSFWDERQALEVERLRAKDTATECVSCGTVDRDVLLGYCSPCFEETDAATQVPPS